MPYKPNILYWQKVVALIKYCFLFSRKPILGATGLLLLASVLLLVVVGSIRPEFMAFTVPKTIVAEPQKTVEVSKEEPSPAAPVIGMQEPKVQETPKASEPVWPVKGKILKDVGWYENSILKEWRYHGGYDIEGKVGQAVKAIQDGEVTDVYNIASSGLTVVIRHGKYTVQYGSLADASVKKGDTVKGGGEIGTIGTFAAEPFPHLHLVIKRGDKLIAPQELLD